MEQLPPGSADSFSSRKVRLTLEYEPVGLTAAMVVAGSTKKDQKSHVRLIIYQLLWETREPAEDSCFTFFH